MRFKPSEIGGRRILDATLRRALDLPHRHAWRRRDGLAEANRTRLRGFGGRHLGARCVLVANGPSLAGMDLSALDGEHVISMNRAYILYGTKMPPPTYYACLNPLVLQQFRADIAALPMPKFLNWDERALFDGRDDLLFLRTALTISDWFGEDLTSEVCSGGTVTFVSLQIAYYLGYRNVVIIGLDHDYGSQGKPNETEVRSSEVDQNHCHPDYFPKGTVWQLPDLTRSEAAYVLARKAFEAAGGRVLDATVGGKCNVFEKADFRRVLSESPSR